MREKNQQKRQMNLSKVIRQISSDLEQYAAETPKPFVDKISGSESSDIEQMQIEQSYFDENFDENEIFNLNTTS